MVGNTEVGIEMKFKAMMYPHLIATTHVPELNRVRYLLAQNCKACRALFCDALCSCAALPNRPHPIARYQQIVGRNAVCHIEPHESVLLRNSASKLMFARCAQIEVLEDGLRVGASVGLTTLLKTLRAQIASQPKHRTSTFRAVVAQLRWFAGVQVCRILSCARCAGSPIICLEVEAFTGRSWQHWVCASC